MDSTGRRKLDSSVSKLGKTELQRQNSKEAVNQGSRSQERGQPGVGVAA
jgi:hypothetical protein